MRRVPRKRVRFEQIGDDTFVWEDPMSAERTLTEEWRGGPTEATTTTATPEAAAAAPAASHPTATATRTMEQIRDDPQAGDCFVQNLQRRRFAVVAVTPDPTVVKWVEFRQSAPGIPATGTQRTPLSGWKTLVEASIGMAGGCTTPCP